MMESSNSTPSTDLHAINEQYSIDFSQCLGRGAYSRVYIGYCHDKRRISENLQGRVAIKHIRRLEMTPRLQDKLAREIEIMQLLKQNPHPNIVKCYDTIHGDEDCSDVYIIMEYCESGDLSQLMKKPIKEKYVQFYMCQLNRGLQFLDQLKIFHRDIKPKNILLTRNRKILKIADFGFAKVVEKEGTLNQTLCGSPLYMAPEIMKKSPSSTKTDLWSIGMIIYEMLFGYHPFKDTETIFDLMYAMESREIEIPPPNNINTKITPACLDLMNRLLCKEEHHRMDWFDFYHHPWLNKYLIEYDQDYRVRNTEKSDPLVSDSLIQSVNEALEVPSSQETTTQYDRRMLIKNEEIEIIDDYLTLRTEFTSTPTASLPIPIPRRKN